jgi:hypothetical protein
MSDNLEALSILAGSYVKAVHESVAPGQKEITLEVFKNDPVQHWEATAVISITPALLGGLDVVVKEMEVRPGR